MKIFSVLWLAFGLFFLWCCDDSQKESSDLEGDSDAVETEENATEWLDPYADQPWRPRYHFTPSENWMNDPNGLVFYKGEYHLFYQYAPEGFVLSPLHWGHAVSTDLVHWEHLPTAIYPDDVLGNAYSGSAVVDRTNSSGLCLEDEGETSCLVALFTHSGGQDGLQKQSLAYSNDRGRTWEMYENNPVLGPDPQRVDFRDPKVLWDDANSCWVMVLATGNQLLFYESSNLLEWKLVSEFTRDSSDDGGAWECPELFEIPLENRENESRWLLEIDWTTSTGGIGSGGRYYVGDFADGSFYSETSVESMLRVDHGSDFYAVQSFFGLEDGSRIWLAWMNNWQYALSVPTKPWQGAMSLPRTIALQADGEGNYQIVQNPVEQLRSLRGNPLIQLENLVVEGEYRLSETSYCTSCEIEVELQPESASDCFLSVFVGSQEHTDIGYDAANGTLYFDRRESGTVDFSPHFPRRQEVAYPLDNGTLRLNVFLDQSTVEVFAGDGETVMSFLVFPDSDSRGIVWQANGGGCTVETLTIYPMESIWKIPAP